MNFVDLKTGFETRSKKGQSGVDLYRDNMVRKK